MTLEVFLTLKIFLALTLIKRKLPPTVDELISFLNQFEY